MRFEKWLIFFFIVNERFCNLFTEAENTPKRLSKLKNVEYKISAKNDPHRLKDGTYFPMFRRVQPIFCPYSVINNYRKAGISLVPLDVFWVWSPLDLFEMLTSLIFECRRP